ncbi:MAG TPA: histidine kinase [Solirubrobacteraceae bacterium]|nr:histidine kinase [Solirubrobacteraceae bacterium]
MSSWWKRSDRGESLALLGTWQWKLRAAVLVIVAAVVLSAHGAIAPGIAELAIAAVAMIGWWASGRLPAPWAGRSLFACLTVLTAVGGFAATSHHDTSVLALAIVSMLAAGVDLPLAGVLVAFLAGVLAIEIGAISYAHTDLGTVLGYPALLAGLAMAGRYRRAYRIQTEQAQALLAETRRAQLEAERVAALTERSRIAREIHDVLAHSLGALGIQLQATEVTLSEHHDIERALRSLASARRLVDEGLTETRRAVRALRTDAPPLPHALAALVDDRPGALTVSGDPYALSPAAGLALLRVAQEAMTNAAKHASGQQAAIALEYTDTGVELRVENALGDAVAIEHPHTAGGYGLAGMHERLRLIDGELHAGPVDDRWVVCARVTR